MNKLIDSHAHLTYDNSSNIEKVITNATQSHVSQIINVCVDTTALLNGIEIAQKHPCIHNAAAISPQDAAKENKEFFSMIETYAKSKKLVAIGETGLDYYYHKKNKNQQINYLIKHIKLAKETSLPLIIHCRDAFNDLFEIIKPYLPFKAVLHCFTGNEAEAKKVLESGWIISFSGIITFNNSMKLQEIAKRVPLEKLIIETDSPFLAPQKYRGQKNQPAFLIEVAKKLADLKNLELDKIIAQTSQNAKNFFNI